MRKILGRDAIRFAGVGAINTMIGVGTIFLLKSTVGMTDVGANFIGYMFGLVFSFLMNKRWTFGHTADSHFALLRFFVVFGISYVLNIVTVVTAIRLGINDYAAHLMGIPVYSGTFYLGCRHFAFSPAFVKSADQVKRHKAGPWRPAVATDGTVWPWLAATLLFAAAGLFYRLDAAPLAVWDEARLANNALEMASTGLSLVTTYGGTPDHWNTKPPLLIWCMALTIRLLGANEWGVRLPSVLSAMFTAAILFAFCAWHLKRPATGFLAVVLLHATPGYMLVHGARAGDYEAMLTLWIAGFVLAGYLLLHDTPARHRMWAAFFASCLLLAFLTKTVQGLIMLPALILYALSQRRLLELLRSKSLYAYAILLIIVCAGYYLLREHLDPGYFAIARANDLGGRYGTVIENHQHGPLYFARQFSSYPWLIPSFLVAAFQVLRGGGPVRQISLFVATASLFYLAIISSSATKIVWYATPLAPLSALLVAIGIGDALDRIKTHLPPAPTAAKRLQIALYACGAVGVVLFNVSRINASISAGSNYLDAYSLFLRGSAISKHGTQKTVVIHPGYPNNQGDPFYIAPTLFYVQSLRTSGHAIDVLAPGMPVPDDADAAVLCGELRHVSTLPLARVLASNGICSLYQIGRR